MSKGSIKSISTSGSPSVATDQSSNVRIDRHDKSIISYARERECSRSMCSFYRAVSLEYPPVMVNRGFDWVRVNRMFQEAYEFVPAALQTSRTKLNRNSRQHVFRKATHCIFDLDGTLFDSEIPYHKTLRKLVEGYGATYTKKLQQECYGGTDRDICQKVVNYLKLPVTVNHLEERLAIASEKMLVKSPMLPGVRRLLRHLSRCNIPFALATNSSEKMVELHEASRPDIFSQFHHKVCATDPELYRGKPFPDIYLLAMHRFNDPFLKPQDCLVFEDSAFGVRAAHDAGMQVVMIPRDPNNHGSTRGATLVIPSLLHFRPELFGMPRFSDRITRKREAFVKINA